MATLSTNNDKIQKKLRTANGESLTETLVAMLVVALGAILLVSMVIAARNIIQRSETSYHSYMQDRSAVEGGTQPGVAATAIFTPTAQPSLTLREKVVTYSSGDNFTYEAATSSDAAQ